MGRLILLSMIHHYVSYILLHSVLHGWLQNCVIARWKCTRWKFASNHEKEHASVVKVFFVCLSFRLVSSIES